MANSSTASPAVLSAIAAADAAISNNALPMKVKTNSPLGNTITSLANLLEQYNKGMLNTGCYIESAITMAAKKEIPVPGDEPTVQNYPNPFNSVTNIRYSRCTYQ